MTDRWYGMMEAIHGYDGKNIFPHSPQASEMTSKIGAKKNAPDTFH